MEKSIKTTAGQIVWSRRLLIYALMLVNAGVYGLHSVAINVTIVEDAVAKGALCLDGSPAGYHYSEGYGDGANNWLVYLAGGGWCGSTTGCLNRVKKLPGVASTINVTITYFNGILSPNQTLNPDFYNWNRVSVRYCDGSSFLGDVEAVDPETNLHFRGSKIFSAVVDELLEKGMRNAQNVILAGNSAGGLATILNCDRFTTLVPNASRVKCISDSGFFIRAKELPNASKRETTFAKIVSLHGIAKHLPTSCTSRMDPGLCFFPENVVGDVETPLFLLNSAFDKFQFNKLSKIINSDFRDTFLETLSDIGGCPMSRGMFINSCYIHDHLYSNPRWNFDGSPILGNKTIAQVVGDWYFDRNSVKLIDDQSDYPIDCHVSE
ncbi:hypothetical protein OROMI_020237 [Orobanche minor]